MTSNSDAVARTALLDAMLDASPGDRSLVEAALQHPEDKIHLTTNANSMNFRLWSQMGQVGWMVQEPDTILPEAKELAIKHFSLTEKGRAALPDFLAAFKRHQLEHSAKMNELFKTLCLPFVRNLHEQATQVGGRGLDIAILTALTLAQIVA